jgi:hypothetical protein
MKTRRPGLTLTRLIVLIATVAVALGLLIGIFPVYRKYLAYGGGSGKKTLPAGESLRSDRRFAPRVQMDTSGYNMIISSAKGWQPDASLEEISKVWALTGPRGLKKVDERLAATLTDEARVGMTLIKASLLNSDGEAARAYQLLEELRSMVVRKPKVALPTLASLTYFQGVTALRRGENDNCIMCRGESSCILPIVPAAVHTNPAGSRLAITHFSEYLEKFPGDLEVRWLLNLAHMTLGEYPDRVDPRFVLDLSAFFHSEFDIGKFRDVGHLVGVNHFNQAGGAIMEDFDQDGLFDLAITTFDATKPMSIYRNKGDGTFEDRSVQAGVTRQLGGLVCYQTDFNNDGRMDIFIPRGAWLSAPIRPTLLRNDGTAGFTDVTGGAGLLHSVNSGAAAWADYDNDGWLDLFVGCEKQTNLLYHNQRDGTFVEVAYKAGVEGEASLFCKGCAWIDYDNDAFPDLFVNHMDGVGRLYHNNHDGTFTDVSISLGIDGPNRGFSCWAWDYDNDGWLDIFATSYDRTMEDVVKGMMGQPHRRYSNRLFHNKKGGGFEDVTDATGLNMVFATMGSNFGDFDNDGWLDMYLGTGDPSLATLVPNRMFKNVGGGRFSEITGSSGTGHLQKGHGVACGDWDRDGDIDLFVQTGGVVNGDQYHNILFQNPGQGHHWVSVKLVGQKTNRAAIGARIKVVTAGTDPLTVFRHVSSGSSFGASPLEQTIGLATAQRVARLEIFWPTSGTTQVFEDIAADRAIEVTEFAASYRNLDRRPVPQPK